MSSPGRAQLPFQELADRCRRISNLYIAYHNSGKSADEFGREFFVAVGEILNGTPIDELELYHVRAKDVEEVLTTPKKRTKT